MICKVQSTNCSWLRKGLSLIGALGLLSTANAQEADANTDDAMLVQGLIQFSPMYSAYDGVHDFQVTPSVPLLAADSDDAIDPPSLKWSFDSAYLKRDDFPDLPGGLRFTTKRAGSTVIKITAKTRSGKPVRDEASVIITQISAPEWDAGYQRFNIGFPIQWGIPNSPTGPCGLPRDLELPPSSACVTCHAPTSAPPLGIEYTPTQTARFNDKELIRLFTEGRVPADRPLFDSPFMQEQPQRNCVFMIFHTWEMQPDEQRGVVAQLRAIAPEAIESIDKTRLTTP